MAITPHDPRAASQLFGHERAAAVLRQAWLSNRSPHAWLLAGPRGVGKATLGFRFARALLAGRDVADDTLGLAPEHPVFRQVALGTHPDLHVVEAPRDPRSGRLRSEIPVDAIRAVTTSLHATAAQGGARILVIDGAEQLNRSAANALLKPLEEPPPGSVLLLIAHHPSRLPATLRSRCAKLRLGPLATGAVEAILAAQTEDLDPLERAALARLARGSAGWALELAASGGFALYQRLARSLGADPVDQLGLHDLAGELARHADAHGLAAPLGLIQAVLGRALAAGMQRLDAPVFAGEASALARLAARRPLDRWAGLWEKIARLAARADAVNLDRFQVLLHILAAMASASGLEERTPGGAQPGGQHVFG